MAEAVALIRPAVTSGNAMWAEFGAGSGLFTKALASLLQPESRIFAIDSDPRAVAALRVLASRRTTGARIVPVEGDFRQLVSIAPLVRIRLDGALFANALHFVSDPGRILREVRARMRESGRIVIVEYDGRPANRWVPYPLSLSRLSEFAAELSLLPPVVLGERPSAYGGIMYSAVLGLPQSRAISTADG